MNLSESSPQRNWKSEVENLGWTKIGKVDKAMDDGYGYGYGETDIW